MSFFRYRSCYGWYKRISSFPLAPIRCLFSPNRSRRTGTFNYSNQAVESVQHPVAIGNHVFQGSVDPLKFDYRQLNPRPTLVYISSIRSANRYIRRLEGTVVGLDVEYTWTKKREAGKEETIHRRPGLLQICDERLILLIHLRDQMEEQLPVEVVKMLQSQKILKVGVGVRHDCMNLVSSYKDQLLPKGKDSKTPSFAHVMELPDFARYVEPAMWPPSHNYMSLALLNWNYNRTRLEKGITTHRGSWVGELTEQQKTYAADDVASSLRIYRRLEDIAIQNNKPLDFSNLARSYKPSDPPRNSCPKSTKT